MKQDREETGLERFEREKKEEAEERRRRNKPEWDRLEKKRQEQNQDIFKMCFILVGIFISGIVFGELGFYITFISTLLYVFRRRIFFGE